MHLICDEMEKTWMKNPNIGGLKKTVALGFDPSLSDRTETVVTTQLNLYNLSFRWYLNLLLNIFEYNLVKFFIL